MEIEIQWKRDKKKNMTNDNPFDIDRSDDIWNRSTSTPTQETDSTTNTSPGTIEEDSTTSETEEETETASEDDSVEGNRDLDGELSLTDSEPPSKLQSSLLSTFDSIGIIDHYESNEDGTIYTVYVSEVGFDEARGQLDPIDQIARIISYEGNDDAPDEYTVVLDPHSPTWDDESWGGRP